ncbi:DUF6270 domain-containing protein [Georgenia sp. SUBG003]|uniref:DUF6270 domain-containing protein n=1 Tax=Georgenia sp. SUBG003 TaxID=1497974 RepID=UPI003AB5B42C
MTQRVRALLYGSCVSRDAFQHLGGGYELLQYVARQSLISAMSPAAVLPAQPSLVSPFQERMVRDDVASTAPSVLLDRADDIDLLVLDLVDERLGVVVLPEGGYATRSQELLDSGVLEALSAPPRRIDFGEAQHLALFTEAASRFVDLLRDTGLLARTLLVDATFAAVTESGVRAPLWRGQPAEAWNRRYRAYVEVLRDAGIRTHTVEHAVAGDAHRWGPAAFHYAPTVYTEIVRAIGTVISERSDVQQDPPVGPAPYHPSGRHTDTADARPAQRARGEGAGMSSVTRTGEHRELHFAVLADALVHPHVPGIPRLGVAEFPGAPSFLPDLRHSPERQAPIPGSQPEAKADHEPDSSRATYLPGRYYYLGTADRHFGHFAVESTSRLWHLLAFGLDGRTPLLVPHRLLSQVDSFGWEDLKGWQRDLLAEFGVPEPVVVSDPVVVEDLLVPQQGALLFSDYHAPAHQDLFYRHDTDRRGIRRSDRKFFLRRPVTRGKGRVAGEDYLAGYLGGFGYETVAPEEFPVADQLAMVRDASHVVGAQGSAFHLFNLLGRSRTDVLLLQRLSDFSSAAFVKTLKPYVGRLELCPPSTRLASTFSSAQDLTFLDTRETLQRLAGFDPAVAPRSVRPRGLLRGRCRRSRRLGESRLMDHTVVTPPERDLRHGAAVHRWDAVDSVRVSDEDRQRHVVASGGSGHLPLDGLLVRRNSDALVVSLHGALERSLYELPRFERLTTLAAGRAENLLFLADTTLGLRSDLNLAWYVGTESDNLTARYAKYIASLAEQTGVRRLVLVGISGGGFAALALSHMLPGSVALAISPQTRIGVYEEWAYERFIETAFPAAASYEEVEASFPRAPRPPVLVRASPAAQLVLVRPELWRRHARRAAFPAVRPGAGRR